MKFSKLRDLPIKTKLTLLLTTVAASAVVLVCILFAFNEVVSMRQSTVEELSAVAAVVGVNTVAALDFNDVDAATEVLASLRLEPMVLNASVYDRNGKVFATFLVENRAEREPDPPFTPSGYWYRKDGTLDLFVPIMDGKDLQGTIYVHAGMEHLRAKMVRGGLMAASVAGLSVCVTIIVSIRLQKVISAPVLCLTEVAENISHEGNYAVRVQKTSNDEIGTLYDAFNRMLEQIETNEFELRRARDELEQRVEQRTEQLTNTNRELSRQVAERERAEKELRDLQASHIEAARKAGMAEIATSVLHNVGNVLNSVNVSASTIADRVRKSGVRDLARTASIIRENEKRIGEFSDRDERGRHLPRFLVELSRRMSADEQDILNEVESLNKNVQHIKDVVALQQSHARGTGLTEEVSLVELIDDAVRINGASLARHKVTVQREIADVPLVIVDRRKVLQILVNLIANAKYALIETLRDEDKVITIRLERTRDSVRIEVSDNGVGIPAENMTRIFSFGFTTRKEGHGFGLHSSALGAKEMGGTLYAHSNGPGTGACFVLELPFETSVKVK